MVQYLNTVYVYYYSIYFCFNRNCNIGIIIIVVHLHYIRLPNDHLENQEVLAVLVVEVEVVVVGGGRMLGLLHEGQR